MHPHPHPHPHRHRHRDPTATATAAGSPPPPPPPRPHRHRHRRWLAATGHATDVGPEVVCLLGPDPASWRLALIESSSTRTW